MLNPVAERRLVAERSPVAEALEAPAEIIDELTG